jgi:Type VI secretion system (T6SS), amidase effector protein 4
VAENLAPPVGFDSLWERYQDARTLGRDINPEGNRCALVLGAALRMKYKPRKERQELSFREISGPPVGIRGQPFLDKFYVKAEDLAKRLVEEWGTPAIKVGGGDASKALAGRRGVVFVEDAWFSRRALAKTVDHIDVWNGSRMGAYDEAQSVETFARASYVWLWPVP